MKEAIPAPVAAFQTARSADPCRPRKAGRRIRWMPGFLETEASRATPPDECGAVAPRSPAHYSLRPRLRHRARSEQATATVKDREARESSGSAIFRRGFG